MSRRDTLRNSAFLGAGALIVGGGGAALALDFRRKMDEQDLTVIGNGTAAIVQVHDPSCADCATLQKQTRQALRQFSPDAVNFRVANIASREGSAFQGQQGLPHVTLALFDGSGERLHVVRGVREADELADIFAYHLGLSAD